MLFTILVATYVLSVFKTVINPTVYQDLCTLNALKNGYPMPIIILTRATQFYTLFSQLGLIVGLYFEHREFVCTALVLQTNMFLLYHVFMYIDPSLLSYEDRDLLENVVYIHKIPRDKNIILWTCLQLQHTYCPIYAWYYVITNNIYHNITDIYLSISMIVFYSVWNYLCWTVQGLPAYPIQTLLYKKSHALYLSVVFACIITGSVVALVIDYFI